MPGKYSLAETEPTPKPTKDSNVVVVFPDHGSRYMSKIYSDQWMSDQGFFDSQHVEETQQIQFVK